MLDKLQEKYAPSHLSRDISLGKMDRDKIKNQLGIYNKIRTLIDMVISSCEATDLFGVCCQMAFIVLFALLPTLLFIILICTQFVSNFENTFMLFLQTVVPVESFNYISQEISLLLGYVSRLRYFITALSAVMGTLSAHTIIVGLNQTYGFKPYSSAKWEWIKSFIMLLTLCIIIVLITVALLWAANAAEQVVESTTITSEIYITERTVNYSFMGIAAIGEIFLLLLGIYIFTPQRRITLRDAWPGTLFATIGIIFIFQIYVRILNRSANYLTIYGSLSGLFILLTALYFLSVMITFGAKINIFFAHKSLK